MRPTFARDWFDALDRIPLMPAAEAKALGNIVTMHREAGSTDHPDSTRAVQSMVQGNLRLVVHLWKRSLLTAVPINDPCVPDLLQEGVVGLNRGAQLFDPGRGYSFTTYASFWIRKGFYDYLRNQHRMIRLPASAIRVMRLSEQILSTSGGTARGLDAVDLENVAEICKTTPQNVRMMLERANVTQTTSLNRSVGEGIEVQDTILDSRSVDPEDPDSDQAVIRSAFNRMVEQAGLEELDRQLLLLQQQGYLLKDLDAMYPDHRPVRRRVSEAKQRMQEVAAHFGTMRKLCVS